MCTDQEELISCDIIELYTNNVPEKWVAKHWLSEEAERVKTRLWIICRSPWWEQAWTVNIWRATSLHKHHTHKYTNAAPISHGHKQYGALFPTETHQPLTKGQDERKWLVPAGTLIFFKCVVGKANWNINLNTNCGSGGIKKPNTWTKRINLRLGSKLQQLERTNYSQQLLLFLSESSDNTNQIDFFFTDTYLFLVLTQLKCWTYPMSYPMEDKFYSLYFDFTVFSIKGNAC